LLVAPHALPAQDATQAWLLTPGARVRVAYAGQDTRVGTLVSLADDTLAVQWLNSTDTARMARARVTRFGVSRGMRPSDRGARAKVGMIVGAGGVLLIAKASGSADSGGMEGIAEGLGVVMGAALAGGVGALIGAATGGPSEEWEDVSLARPHVRLMVPTRNHGPGIGLALRF
jgi:hypothetical protein